MSQCKHCHRILDRSLESSVPSGPALEESWMLLPHAISHRPFHPTMSLTQSTFLRDPWEESIHMDSNNNQSTPSQHTSLPSTSPPLAQSVLAHADLSLYVQQLNLYRAHCSGMPMTSPACKECVDTMLQEIDTLAEQARQDKRSFGGYLQMTTQPMGLKEDMNELYLKIAFYEKEVETLEENLELMENERQMIRSQQEALEKEQCALAEEVEGWWKEWNTLYYDTTIFHEGRDRGRKQLEALEREVIATRNLPVLTRAFVIRPKGAFGTINGFRLGQLPTVHVEWNEINAALGEGALLVHTVGRVLGVEWTEFKIVPLGTFSKIIRTTSVRMEYALHGSDQDNFIQSHFNLGLCAWIACIHQLIVFVETQDPSIHLPYTISNEYQMIQGYSILYLKNYKPVEWTKAFQYTLTNLKWILKWVTTRWLNLNKP